MPTPAETLTIENVVASTGIDQELDLATLVMDLDGAEYNPDNFPGLVYRIHDPQSAALIFRSGKIVSTGADSIAAVNQSLHMTFEELRSLGIPVAPEPTITVQNIVTSADLGQSLNLNAIAIGFGLENVEYEPEQFPGLVYRLSNPELVTLLFASGKIVITGGTDPEEAEQGIEQLLSDLDSLGLIEAQAA